jgi:hypothetical protein
MNPYRVHEDKVSHIASLFPRVEKKDNRKTERGELMHDFLQKLNPSREKAGLKPLTMGRLGLIFEKVPTQDLYHLFKECEKARNFSSLFWWKHKNKKL